MNAYAVIMAGGSGERFWPLSRTKKPKQLLRLTSERMMIEEAIDRIAPIIPPERILIITSRVLQQPIIDALPGLPPENVIAEPAKRNTAPCLALACSVIEARERGDALMAVLTADHFIGNVEAFRHDVTVALDHAMRNDALVTLGIPPTRPETGYGYIRMTDRAAPSQVTKVAEFREKPTIDVAMQYLRSGEYVWNSGMFFWRTHALASAMHSVLPEVGAGIQPMTEAIASNDMNALEAAFASQPDISIDYGVMERASNVFVVPASFPWDDVGSWDSLDRMQQQDAQGNVVQGACTVIDTNNSVIVNAHSDSHVVTGVGLDDMVVVVTPDATMVCPKERAQDVKLIVKTLREQGRSDVL
ncbi:MAG: mannose-1-phosphate guanylyltransferase [Candidatus Kapabacteria bacterium]|nr:mannose-1-phosphate guanylyltransferase [Candidatus Kapabacteria bacterium]